jgi:hypothetical protein
VNDDNDIQNDEVQNFILKDMKNFKDYKENFTGSFNAQSIMK